MTVHALHIPVNQKRIQCRVRGNNVSQLGITRRIVQDAVTIRPNVTAYTQQASAP